MEADQRSLDPGEILFELGLIGEKSDRGSVERKRELCAQLRTYMHLMPTHVQTDFERIMGQTCAQLYKLTGYERHGADACSAYRRALTNLDDSENSRLDRAFVGDALGSILQDLYDDTGNTEYFDDSLRTYAIVRSISSGTALQRVGINVGNLYSAAFRRTGHNDHFAEARRAYLHALWVLRKQDRVSYLVGGVNLCSLYYHQLRRKSVVRGTVLAARRLRRAVTAESLSSEEFVGLRQTSFQTLIAIHTLLFQLTHDVEHQTLIAELCGASQPDATADLPEWHVTVLAELAKAPEQLQQAFLLLSQLERVSGVESATQRHQLAMQLLVECPVELVILQAALQLSLGNAHGELFHLLGNDVDSSNALVAFEGGVTNLQSGACPALKGGLLVGTSAVLMDAFRRHGALRVALDASIALRGALQEFETVNDVEGRRRCHTNLGALFASLFDLSNEEGYAEEGREHTVCALALTDRVGDPLLWSTMQLNLAQHYSNTSHKWLEGRGLLDEARDACTAAFDTLLPLRSSAGEAWARAHDVLATIESASGRHLEAKLALEEALRLWRANGATMRAFMTRVNLAYCQLNLFEQTSDSGYATGAEGEYRRLLGELRPVATPHLAVKVTRSLGRLLAMQRRWPEACVVLAQGQEALQNQGLLARGDRERWNILRREGALFMEESIALANAGKEDTALGCLEEGRAQLLRERGGLESAARSIDGGNGLALLKKAQDAVRIAEVSLRQADLLGKSIDVAQRAMDTAMRDLRECVSRMGIAIPSVNVEELKGALVCPSHAFVYFAYAYHEALAIIVHNGSVRLVRLPKVTTEKLLNWVEDLPPTVARWMERRNDWSRAAHAAVVARMKGDPSPAIVARIAAAQLAWKKALQEILASGGDFECGWFFAYQLAFESLRGAGTFLGLEPSIVNRVRQVLAAVWEKTVTRVLGELEEALWLPLMAALPQDVTDVTFSASKQLSLLPVHAAAPERINVSYAPSTYVLGKCQAGVAQALPARTYAVLDPHSDPNRPGFLAYSNMEARIVQSRLEMAGCAGRLFTNAAADRRATLDAVTACGVVHFAGHGQYSWKDPAEAALVSYDGELTLEEIRSASEAAKASLVVLSACSTGMTDVLRSGEEFVGLPGALIEAGISTVIGSFWPVLDKSTALLMDRFYEIAYDKRRCSVGAAINGACKWLRDLTIGELRDRVLASRDRVLSGNERLLSWVGRFSDDQERPFASPVHWAPFAAFGAAGWALGQ